MDKHITPAVERMASTKPQYLTLEELDLFGDIDSLPFPLDAAIWQDRTAALALLAEMQNNHKDDGGSDG
jgi:hypothetical protein